MLICESWLSVLTKSACEMAWVLGM